MARQQQPSEAVFVALKNLLDPQTIAIVGVSTKKATFQVGGRAILEHLQMHGYRGRIDIVTREPVTIGGMVSVTDLAALPHVPDCVVVSVPAREVYATVEGALALGCRAFVVITGGFSESGHEGAALQERLAALVSSHGAVMLGPNTTGFVNFGHNIATSSTSRISAGLGPAGGIGLIIQSGALGSGLLEEASRNGVGLSYLISTGNEAATGLASYIEYLVDDPSTRAIALYVESFREPGQLLRAARRAHAAGKPIVLYKSGRSEAGRRAAAGHTGALMGARRAYDAAVRQLGWIDVRSIEDLLQVANYAALGGSARSMGVLTVSGGYGGCVADALEETGSVSLPPPGPATVERMRGDVPAFLSAANPIDIGGTPFRRPGGFAACLDALADDPAMDAVAVANTPIVPDWAAEISDAVKNTRARTGKPVSVIWSAENFNSEALADLRAAGVPVFTRVDTFTASVAGAAAAARSHQTPSRLLRDGRDQVTPRIDGELKSLDEQASKTLLSSMGVEFPVETFVQGRSISGLVEAAAAVGYPVTLKGIARGVAHKSEYGLVAVALAGEDALAATARSMLDSADRHKLDFEGFIVAETVRPQVEMIVGLSVDPEFGPMLTIGAGGIYTEIMQDVVLRVLPVDENEIREAIDTCRISGILHGARGRPKLDVDALVKLVSHIASLSSKLGPDFAGLEINPVGVGKQGEGAWALDATVFSCRSDT